MIPTRFLLGAAGAFALSTAAAAQSVLVQYDPVGAQATGTPVFPTTVAPTVTATDLTQTGFVGGWTNTNVWPVGRLGAASATLDPSQYVEFSITPMGSLQLTQLSYSRNSYVNEGNRAASVRTSLDGFMADVDTLTGLAPTGAVQHDFDLTSLPSVAATLDVRIYFYDAPTRVSTGSTW